MLVEENGYLVVYLPPTSRALVFRVLAIQNEGFTKFRYGALPFTSGEVLATLDGGTATVPASGVIPARAYNSTGKTFSLSGAYDETDMWYLPEDYRDRVFHVIQNVTPSFLRMDLQIPLGISQARFQRDKISGGVDKDFGYSRGSLETVHLPRIHYGYRWANDTNMKLYTGVEFIYGEYIVTIPKDPELIFAILTKKVPSKWITLPLSVYDASIRDALVSVYGFEGFKLFGSNERATATRTYASDLREVMV